MMKISQVANPLQAVMVTCRGNATHLAGIETPEDNVITVAWHTPISFEPALYAISIGKKRHSLAIIRESKVFCVNFIPIGMEKQALFCGRNSGINVNKFAKANLTVEECERIDCPRLAFVAGFIECEVISEIDAGDHILFIGKAILARAIDNHKRLFFVKESEFTTTEF